MLSFSFDFAQTGIYNIIYLGLYVPEEECIYVSYGLSAYVLAIITSVGGLWTRVLDFQNFDKAICTLIIEFKKGTVTITRRSLLHCNKAKFASHGGIGWLLQDLT